MKALDLLNNLLQSSENAKIEEEGRFTHTLGELFIKGELAKVFFPEEGRFAGAYVALTSLGISIDYGVILDQLHQLKAQKKQKGLLIEDNILKTQSCIQDRLMFFYCPPLFRSFFIDFLFFPRENLFFIRNCP